MKRGPAEHNPEPGELPQDRGAQRGHVAQLIEDQRDSINKRISWWLMSDARALADTEDVLSTAMRRVDRLVAEGKFRGESDAQVYALVHRVIDRTIREKVRSAKRLRLREKIALELEGHTRGGPYISAAQVHEIVVALTDDPIDKETALLRARGLRFHEIAESVGMQPAGVRKRWSRLRERAQNRLTQGDINADL